MRRLFVGGRVSVCVHMYINIYPIAYPIVICPNREPNGLHPVNFGATGGSKSVGRVCIGREIWMDM